MSMVEKVARAIQCPRCAGKGWSGPVHVNMGDGKHEWRERIECLDCGGKGEISAAQASAMAEGQKHYRARVARMESLRECSQKLGIGPAALCDYEWGRTFGRGYDAAKAAIDSALAEGEG